MSDDLRVPQARNTSVSPQEPLSQPKQKKDKTSETIDSTLSLKDTVRIELPPSMETPRLIPPGTEDCHLFVVTSVDSSGKATEQVIHSFIQADDSVKLKIWEEYNKNLREIGEYVRQLLSNPFYQELLLITSQDSLIQKIEGSQGTSPPHISSLIQQMTPPERACEIEPTKEKDSTPQVFILPLTGALLASGLVIGVASGPGGGLITMIENLTPLFPQVAIQDVIPLINLMIMGPITFNSFQELCQKGKNNLENERTHIRTIQKFSKDVLKITRAPSFIETSLILQLKGSENLSTEDIRRLGTLLRIILLGVALSLMYSAEVGKVQDRKFFGITPEEFKSLLQGEWHDLFGKCTPKNEHEEITLLLIRHIWENLKILNPTDRAYALNMLLTYVTEQRDLNPMLEPAKVFKEALESQTFHFSSEYSDLPEMRG